MIIIHIGIIQTTKIHMKRINLLFYSILLSGCALSPGMNFESKNINGIEKVYVEGYVDKYIEVETISSELIVSDMKTNEISIDSALMNYEPDEYTIGSGDVLSISVWGPEELFPRNVISGSPYVDRVVRNDGTIFYPYVGNVTVNGKSREQVRSMISESLSELFIDVQVDVTVSDFNSKRVILSGAFINPGKISLTEVPITLSEAISKGGSPSETADLSRLKLIRDNKTYELDYEYLARNASEIHQLFISDGDVIHIPFDDEKKVYVVGEVVRQSQVELRRRTISLSDAIARSGGLSSSTASGSQVYIIRKAHNLNEARIFKLDLNSPAGFILAGEFRLEPQDIVFVGPANIARWNRVIAQFFPFTTFLNTVDNLQNN